jgi:putative addiction module component (TIGR02574 family)
MNQTVEKLKAELEKLTSEERAELAHYLIHSLDAEEDADAEASWQAELDRRSAQIRSGQASGKPAPQVFQELREKHA